MSMMNRLGNARNPYQGTRKRVLCVCSAGLLRSPTMAWVFSNEPYGWNTRAAGIEKEYALIPVDQALIRWADLILCAEDWQRARILDTYLGLDPSVVIALNIPDEFEFRDPRLVEIIKEKASTLLTE